MQNITMMNGKSDTMRCSVVAKLYEMKQEIRCNIDNVEILIEFENYKKSFYQNRHHQKFNTTVCKVCKGAFRDYGKNS